MSGRKNKKISKLSEPLQQCYTVLKAIGGKETAHPFMEPVDWQYYGLNDYPEIIKEPMDLGTIMKKLEQGSYKEAEDFANDVRLVWRNAKTYNRQDSAIYEAADILSKAFEKKFTKIKSKSNKRSRSASSISEQDRIEFSQLIAQLSSDHLGHIVSFIQRDCPQALTEEQSEIEIDINSIDDGTLTNLMAFAQNRVKPRKKRK